MTSRRIVLIAVSIVVLVAIVTLPGLRVRASGSDVVEHLPVDPIAAGVYDLELVDWVDDWIARIGRFSGKNDTESEVAKAYAELDEKIGMSFRDDVLGAFGPGIAFAVELPSSDELAEGGWSEEAVMLAVMRKSVVVARIDGPERAIRAFEGLMTLAGGQLTADEDERGFTLSGGFLGKVDDGVALHGRMSRHLLVLSASPDRAAESLTGFPRGARLTDGADYTRVATHVEAAPESMTYFNLPKVREWFEASAASLGNISGPLQPFLEDDWMGVGMISASVRTDGGLRSSRFGPEPLAGGLASMWFSGAGGMGMLMNLPRLIGEVAKLPSQNGKRTMADLRSIGTSIEGFSIDNNRYPRSSGWVPIERIGSELSPTYIRTLPTTDAWGHAILYWSDGTTYRVVSPGADGVIEREWSGEAPAAKKTADPNADIVFADGSFAVWPER